jgi:uncharacterized protein YjbI with pentapeptide repeats
VSYLTEAFFSGGRFFFTSLSTFDPLLEIELLLRLLSVIDLSELDLLLVAIKLRWFCLLSITDRSEADLSPVVIEARSFSLISFTRLFKTDVSLCGCSFSTVELSKTDLTDLSVADSNRLCRGTLLLLPHRSLMAARALRVTGGRVILPKKPHRDAFGACSVGTSFSPAIADSDALRRGTLLPLERRFLMNARALSVTGGRVNMQKTPHRGALGARVGAPSSSGAISSPLTLAGRAIIPLCWISATLVPSK